MPRLLIPSGGMRFFSVALMVSAALLAPALRPQAARGQEVGVLAVRTSSANPELPGAHGFGAFAQLEAMGWQARLSYLRYADDTRKSGTVCQVYSPRIGCRTEGVSTTARLSGARVSVMRALALGEWAQVGVGAGVSFNSLSARSLGESGQRADLYMPNTGQLGYLGSASVAVTPVRGVPLRIVGGASGHWVNFNGCANPEDRTSGYAPFCGWERFVEVQLGVSVVIPRS